MTTNRTQEARQVSNAYHLAIAYLGYSVMEGAWREWQAVDLARPRTTSAAWADAVLALVRAARGQARVLARAFYRLFRALHTGKTVPGEDGGDDATLGDLRRDFRNAVEDIVPAQRQKPTTEHTKRAWERAGLDEPLPQLPTGGFEEKVEVEDFDWDLDDDDDIEDVLDAHFNNVIADLERERQQRSKGDAKVTDFEKWLEDRREKVGTTQAGASQLSVLNAGRRELYLAGGKDARAIGYIRVSKTGDPCHFCAMLLSRGLVLYKTEKGAVARESDGEKYHPNCNCVAEPVFSRSQYESDDKFALNREMQKLWKEYIHSKYSGDEAINAWRRLLRRRRADALTTQKAADARAA